MRLSVMQPYFFPYIGYWQLMQVSDTFIIYDDAQFKRRSFMTRNRILLNGKVHRFSLPTVKAPQSAPIRDIQLDKQLMESWHQKFMDTLHHAYHNAPQFHSVITLLEEIISNYHPFLSVYLTNSMQRIKAYLGIQVQLLRSSRLEYNRGGTAEDKIVSLCKSLGANTYINPEGGKELYDRQNFKREGIELYFLHSGIRAYDQFGLSFKNNLSIIDLLMFLDKDSIRERLHQFELH